MDSKALERILALSAGERMDYDPSQTWVDLYRHQVRICPEHPAVVAENGSLTYLELDRLSDQLAAALIEKEGVQPDEFIAVRMGRVREFHIAVLAIHKAGAAYMPVDLDYPADRVAYMMEDSGARLTLTEQSVAGLLEYAGGAGRCPLRCHPDSRAYMIYTSGSTGKPKGVVIPQRALTNFVHFIVRRWGLGPHSRIALHSNFAFDAAVEDLFPALTAGGSVFVVPESARKDTFVMRDYIAAHQINGGSYSTQFGQLLAMDEPLDVDYLCMGGEAMTVAPLARGPVYNVYGPTEFTVDATYYELEKGREYDIIPIGRPLYNCAAYIVNDRMELLPPGETGELCLAGPQLAEGYWNREALTAEKFTALQLPDGEAVRVYRTGDLARWNDEGQLEFCGRVDTQVKLRGFRVELGEVESRAARWPGIRQTAAEVRKNTLCLYYTASEEVDEAALSAFMAETLADYMVPDAFIRLGAMPHNVNGKIDRKALPDPVMQAAQAYAAPETEAEREAAAAMARVLGIDEPLGVTSDFFEMGGDSIKAIRLVSALRNQGYAASVADVMKARTARALARTLASSSAESISQEPVEGEITDTAIFAFFRDLNYPNPAYYNQSTLLTVRGKADPDALQRASDAILRQHDMLRAVLREGHLWVRPAGETVKMEEYVLEADETGAVRALCEEIQSHLDPGKSLVRLALIHAGARDLFFLTAHHTIVDGVSWRVWMDDLETAYGQAKRGEAVRLPAKTHTYRDYAEAMKAYRSGYALSLEIPYWKDVEARMLRLDTSDNRDYTRRFETLSAAMTKEETDGFLNTRLNLLRLEVNDLLLTALGQGYRQVFGQDAVSVSMEGHGREELGGKLSLDRTIGRFTSIYPVVLEGFTGEAKADLIRVKETLHAVPNKGVGYNILAFVDGTPETGFQTDRAPMVIFNYLGDVSGEGERGEYFAPDSADGFSAGLDYGDPRNHDGSDLVINCLVDSGCFTLWLDYNSARFTGEQAQAFASSVLQHLTALSGFLNAQAGELQRTASDLGETEWSPEEFEGITARFAERGETLRRIYPLTPMQEGMLLEHVTHPESRAYRLIDIYECARPLDERLLRRAVDELGRRHEALRTAIIHKGVSRFRQAVVDRNLPLTVVDLTQSADPFADAQKIRLELLDSGYDLQDRPLTRFVYCRTGQGGYLLFATHHIITDGWCFETILRDLNALLRGEALTENSDGQYEQAVREQLRRDKNAALRYFTDLLAGYESSAVIPSWGEVPEAERDPDDQIRGVLPADLTARLSALCAGEGATLADGFNLAWGLVLRTLNRTEDVAFTTIASGRDGYSMDVSDLVGLFINPVPVRLNPGKDATARQALAGLNRQAGETKPYDFCPLADIQRALGCEIRLSGLIISFENYMEGDAGEAVLRPALIREVHEVGSVDVDASVQPDGSISLILSYDPALWRRPEMERILRLFSNYVEQITAAPDAPLRSLPHMNEADRAAMLAMCRGGRLEYDASLTWVDLFKAQAARCPEHPAVAAENGMLTYRELDVQSDRLAAKLAAMGVAPGDFVAVRMSRVKEFHIAVLAIHKAGAAYLPIDLDYPEDRVQYMLSDSGAGLLLTESAVGDMLAAGSDDAPEAVRLCRPDSHAYMIYTSGSTGKPKGVVIPQRALTNFVHFIAKRWGLGEQSRVSLHSNFAFDAAVEDLFPALTVGGTVFVVPERARRDIGEMRKYLRQNRINSGCYSTQFGQLLGADGELDLDYICVGGEAMTAVPRCRGSVYNTYGPTEFTVDATFFELEKGRTYKNIPIGRPLYNCAAYILDGSLEPLPNGLMGELCLAGPQLAEGYWNREALTAEKFTELRLTGEEKVRIYRTGDLARYNEQGQLEFLGRIDFQVKLRGFRIELGEIESRACQYPGIRNAAAEVRREQLVLYYSGDAPADRGKLRAYLAESLADYMVPAACVFLKEMPMTPNGKINRRALPDVEFQRTGEEYAAPRNETEKRLCGAFAQVLNLSADHVGIRDDFFELGGDSIKCMRVVSLLGMEGLTTLDLYRERTPEKIAAALAQRGGEITFEGEKRARGMTLPASSGQVNMVDYQFVHVHSVMYNMPMLYAMPPDTDADRLIRAVTAAIGNHPALCTVLEMDESGGISQRYRPELMPEIRLEEVPPGDLDRMIRESVQPFAIFRHPLTRARVFRCGEKLYLFMDMHHTVSDGTSLGILLADIVSAYRGGSLPEDYYYSYLLAEARASGTDEYQNAKYYFEGVLGQCEWCNVPTPDYESWEADAGEERMNMGLSPAQIHAAQARLGASGNMICIAAALLALQEYCGRQDVLVNWIDHNRTDAHYENTVGMLFRILPVAVRMDRCGTVEKLLREVSRQVAMGFANSSCDFMSERESALEDTMEINYQVGVWDGDPLAALGAEEIGLRPEGQATGGRVGMYIEDWPGDTVGVVVEYQRKAYAEGSMARFLDIFRKHLRRIVTGREDTDEKD